MLIGQINVYFYRADFFSTADSCIVSRLVKNQTIKKKRANIIFTKIKIQYIIEGLLYM